MLTRPAAILYSFENNLSNHRKVDYNLKMPNNSFQTDVVGTTTSLTNIVPHLALCIQQKCPEQAGSFSLTKISDFFFFFDDLSIIILIITFPSKDYNTL